MIADNVRVIEDPIALERLSRLVNRVEKVINQGTPRRLSGLVPQGANPDPRRDYGQEFGHPDTSSITIENYRELYHRHPIAKKVVDILANHCWQSQPTVVEDEDRSSAEGPFEVALQDLGSKLRGEESWYQGDEGNPLWECLSRVDRISGIGHYGVLLMGVAGDEGKDLSIPLELNRENRELIYLKALPQYLAEIVTYEEDRSNPRFGKPKTYSITLGEDTNVNTPYGVSASRGVDTPQTVHWTRTIHIVDEVLSNEVLHIPRMLPVFDRLLDLTKLYGGSAEMYYQGAMPGLSFETHPQLGGDVEIDVDTLRDQTEYYYNSLQRYLVTSGLAVNSLAPQVVDPSAQIDVQIEAICIAKDCPKRIFMGSERGELASSQDKQHWNEVVQGHRRNHVTPEVIVPTINHFIQFGILPRPTGYSVLWPKMETISMVDQADVAIKITQALVAFIQGDGVELMPIPQYLTLVLGFSQEEAMEIMEALDEDGMIDRLKEDALKEEEEKAQPFGGTIKEGAEDNAT